MLQIEGHWTCPRCDELLPRSSVQLCLVRGAAYQFVGYCPVCFDMERDYPPKVVPA